MEFQRERVYTALNADELRAGDKVIVAMSLAELKENVQNNVEPVVLEAVLPEHYMDRFSVHVIKKGDPELRQTALAYLVERKENCTNCVHREGEGCKPNVSPVNCCPCYDREVKQSYIEPKTEQKAEMPELISLGNGQYAERKHYQPFKDTDELIKVWDAKIGTPNWGTDGDLTMPHIWVRCKASGNSYLITGYFTNDNEVCFSATGFSMNDLLKDYEFLDGSPCGVEE